MGIASLMVEFFHTPQMDEYYYLHNPVRYRTLTQFVQMNVPRPDIPKIIRLCNKLENEGFIERTGSSGPAGDPMTTFYRAVDYNPDRAKHETYDLYINGFAFILEYFRESVRRVVVKKGVKQNIGTCFVVGDNTLVTAYHCIYKMDVIRIEDQAGGPVEVDAIWRPINEKMDLAIIRTIGTPFKNIHHFTIGPGQVLDEIMVMGYPELKGFNAPLIASRGDIVATDPFLYESLDYHLLNAQVKGGNSGGPVIDRFGGVVGIIISLPSGTSDTSKAKQFDKLGFAMALTGAEILKIRDGDKNPDLVQPVRCRNIPGEGFKTA